MLFESERERAGALLQSGRRQKNNFLVAVFVTPWTVACQAPLSMEFSRPAHWSGLPFPSPEELPNPGIEHGSSALQEDSLPFQLQGSLWA